MDDVTRATLLLRLKDQTDQVSWAEFDARYHRLLYGYARAKGASHDDAEEVVQEVEFAIFKSIGNFDYDVSKGRFRGYLRRAVANALNRRAARAKRAPQSIDPTEQDYILVEEDQQDEVWEQQWRHHRIRQAMERIAESVDAKTIEAFTMHVLDEQPVETVCEKMNITHDNLYQIKHRLMDRLRIELEEINEEL
ncbi:MAG: sigma-70 family RNA polymerase sigma factor [Phycisphaerales bacterium]|nr:sigma-70 family RNA polymerase sigma factor [Phycisphaerales bacterium]